MKKHFRDYFDVRFMNLVSLLVICSLVPFHILLSTPAYILMNNIDYLLCSPYNVLLFPFFLFVLSLTILFAMGFILRGRLKAIYILTLLSICSYLYIETYIINFQYGGLTGQALDFSHRFHQHAIEAGIGILILIVFIAGRRLILNKYVSFASALLIFNLIIFIYSVVDTTFQFKKKENKPSYLKTFEVSSNFNIFHVVFDSFQTDVFLDILENNPSYKSIFTGFTLFTNNSGSFIWTSMAYPLMFSSQDHTKYDVKKIYGDKPFLMELFDHGFKLNITFQWSDSWYGKKIKLNGFNNIWEKMKPKAKSESVYSILGLKYSSKSPLLIDLSLFRSLPSFFKEMIYRDGKWFLQNFFSKGEAYWFAYAYHSIEIFNEYIGSIQPIHEAPTYNLIHLNIPHRPFVLDEDCNYHQMDKPEWYDFSRKNYYKQSHCAVKSMIAFLDKLRELNIYNNSIILFQADTGLGIDVEMENLPENYKKNILDEITGYDIKRLAAYAMPLLAVKGACSTEPMQISRAPVNQANTRSSILKLAGIDISSEIEKTFFSVLESEKRRRVFITNSWESRTSGLIDRYHKFEIIGRVNDFNSWIDHGVLFNLESESYPKDHYSVVSVKNATSEFRWNREGWSTVEGPYPQWNINKQVVWMYGPSAVIDFKYPEKSHRTLKLQMTGRPIFNNLTLTFKVNNKVVGEHTFKDKNQWENAMIIFEVKNGTNKIVIESSKWLKKTQIDGRPLSILFKNLLIQ